MGKSKAGDPHGYTGETTIGDTQAYVPTNHGAPLMPAAGGLPASALYTKVDYNWMAYFGKVLRDLDPEFQKAIDGLSPLTFNPGTRFMRGRELQNEIVGRGSGSGLKNAALENLAHFRQACAQMAEKVETLAKNYQHCDELSKIQADRITQDMGEVLGEVGLMPQMSLPGGGSGSGGGTGSGDGGGSSGGGGSTA